MPRIGKLFLQAASVAIGGNQIFSTMSCLGLAQTNEKPRSNTELGFGTGPGVHHYLWIISKYDRMALCIRNAIVCQKARFHIFYIITSSKRQLLFSSVLKILLQPPRGAAFIMIRNQSGVAVQLPENKYHLTAES